MKLNASWQTLFPGLFLPQGEDGSSHGHLSRLHCPSCSGKGWSTSEKGPPADDSLHRLPPGWRWSTQQQ